jgi:hypothetical protein
MSCERYRRRISDDIDGALRPDRRAGLERHIDACAKCRAHRAELLALQRTTNIADPRLPEPFWTDFHRRLDARLALEVRGPREPARTKATRGPARGSWARAPWAWAAAASLILAVLGGVFLLRWGVPDPSLEAVFIDDPLGRILDVAGSNQAFEGEFDRDVQASIDEAVLVPGEESFLPAGNDPFFWESLSEAELEFIESELRAEKTHGGAL